MDVEETLLTIGELSRRSGMPVRTIRYWSDIGAVPPTGRSAAGYRLYDAAAVARLALVRALRELDVDHQTVRRVLERETTLPEVAATHVAAIDARIRTLRLQRAVLRTVVARHTTPEEMAQMTDLTQLTAAERRRIVADFLDEVFDGTAPPGEEHPVERMMRESDAPLPDDATPAQVDAWVELAGLVADPAFRARCRAMAVAGAAAPPPDAEAEARQRLVERAGAAQQAGVDPAGTAGGAVLREGFGDLASATGRPDGGTERAAFTHTLDTFSDARVRRYWALVGTLNDWPPQPDMAAPYDWLRSALAAHPGGGV